MNEWGKKSDKEEEKKLMSGKKSNQKTNNIS